MSAPLDDDGPPDVLCEACETYNPPSSTSPGMCVDCARMWSAHATAEKALWCDICEDWRPLEGAEVDERFPSDWPHGQCASHPRAGDEAILLASAEWEGTQTLASLIEGNCVPTEDDSCEDLWADIVKMRRLAVGESMQWGEAGVYDARRLA